MTIRILPVALILSVAAGTMAFAGAGADDVGAIKAINPAAMSFTLADGTTYTLSADFNHNDVLDGFRVGDKVSVRWLQDGASREATEVTSVD